MPFDAPTTVASQATTGYLGTLEIGDSDSSPFGYEGITELKSFKGNYFSTASVDVSHLLSPNATEEPRAGMLRPGTITFSGNFIGDSAQLGLMLSAKASADQSQPTVGFRVKLAVQDGAKTYTAVGLGFVSKHEVGPAELNKPIEFAGEMQIVGLVSESVA